MLSSPRQLALALSERPAASFANFVAGRNAELLAVLRALARGHSGERFVYLWGARGSGRGHLLQALAGEASACSRRTIRLAAPVAADALTRIDADTVVALAGIERLDGDAQAALFGLYNRIREAAGALVVSGEAAPARLPVRPDLATRLAWGLVYEVHALSDDDKAEAMRARATQHGFELSAEVQAYVLRHGRRDMPSLLSLVDRIERHSLETQRPVTIALVREVLKDVQSTLAGVREESGTGAAGAWAHDTMTPAEAAARDLFAPAQAPAEDALAPAQAPARGTLAPAQMPAKDALAPATAPAKDTIAPAKEPAKDTIAPAKEPAKDTIAPAKEPAQSGGGGAIAGD